MQKNFFVLDNNLFNLKLDAYEFMIYSYLVCRAGKKKECWPSINHIASMLNISTCTVVKKIDKLISKKLIEKHETIQVSKNGRVRTSNNHYFILNFEEAFDNAFRFNHSKLNQ